MVDLYSSESRKMKTWRIAILRIQTAITSSADIVPGNATEYQCECNDRDDDRQFQRVACGFQKSHNPLSVRNIASRYTNDRVGAVKMTMSKGVAVKLRNLRGRSTTNNFVDILHKLTRHHHVTRNVVGGMSRWSLCRM